MRSSQASDLLFEHQSYQYNNLSCHDAIYLYRLSGTVRPRFSTVPEMGPDCTATLWYVPACSIVTEGVSDCDSP